MKILVTGGAGYIGSIVVEQLLERDYQVVVIDNFQEGNHEAVLPQAAFYEADFGDRNVLEEVFEKHNIDVVFHFAAESTIEFSMTDPARYNLGNGEGFSVLEVVEMVSKVSGQNIPITEAPRRHGDPAVLIASAELAKQELGWKPKYDSLEEIIWTAWGWHRRHPDGYGGAPTFSAIL